MQQQNVSFAKYAEITKEFGRDDLSGFFCLFMTI